MMKIQIIPFQIVHYHIYTHQHNIQSQVQYFIYILKDFLTTKKSVEDDLILTLKNISEMRMENNQITMNQLNEQLTKKKKQLESIKRKLNKSCEDQMKIYDVMKKRIHRHQIADKNINTVKNNADNHIKHQDKNHLNGVTNGIKKGQKVVKVELVQNDVQIQTEKQQKNHQNNINFVKQQLQNNQQINNVNHNNSNNNEMQIQQSDLSKKQRQLFQLNLNKQIAFYMLEQSLKKQKIIKLRQSKLKLQQSQEKGIKDDIEVEVEVEKKQQKQSMMKQEVPQLKLNSLFGGYDVLMDPQYVQQLVSAFSGYNSSNQIDLLEFNKNNQKQINYYDSIQSKKLMRKIFIQYYDRKEEEIEERTPMYQYHRNDLFDQNVFIKAIDSSRMDEETVLQVSGNKQANEDYSKFQGQIQLQCMLLRKREQISSDILSNQFNSVNHFIYENSHMIKKHNSNLQFWVIICNAIELIRSKEQQKQMKGIEMIRNKVAKMKGNIKEWQRMLLESVAGMLLVNKQQINIQTYLQKTQTAFKEIFQLIYRLPDPSKFLYNIYSGALMLKTPSCIHEDKQNPLICPLCNSLAQKVFKPIPLLTKHQSTLICRINKSVMDHENYPLILPSNQIYSLTGLQQTRKTTRTNVGKIIQEYYCPITCTWYAKQKARKVYLA